MPDLADNLAAVFVRAAIRAAGNHSQTPVNEARDDLAADLRRILSTELPAWYAGYDAAQEDAAGLPITTATGTIHGATERVATCHYCAEPIRLAFTAADGSEVWCHPGNGQHTVCNWTPETVTAESVATPEPAPKFDPVYGHRVYRPDLAPAARPEPPTTVSALLEDLAELADDLDSAVYVGPRAADIVRRARAVIAESITERGEA